MHRICCLLLLCTLMTACGDERRDDLKAALEEARVDLQMGVTVAGLGQMLVQLERAKLLAADGLNDWQTALTNDFMKNAVGLVAAWRNGFGCEIQVDSFIDTHSCPDGAATLNASLIGLGLPKATVEAATAHRNVMLKPLLADLMAELSHKAGKAAKSL